MFAGSGRRVGTRLWRRGGGEERTHWLHVCIPLGDETSGPVVWTLSFLVRLSLLTVRVRPMCAKGLYLLAVLSGLAASAVLRVSGITIYTPSNVEAVNGTDVRLKCTFHSIYAIKPDLVTISWSFRPLTPGQEQSVFHYQQRPYPPLEGIFRNHIVWAGDIMGRDASITIHRVKFDFNGTYICQVRNPPDVHGTVGEIQFRVVTTASFSELLLLALGIGGGIAAVVILLVLFVSCRRCKRRRQRQLEENEESPRKERKDPSVW